MQVDLPKRIARELGRRAFTPDDEALIYAAIREKGMRPEVVAVEVGCTVQTVYNCIRRELARRHSAQAEKGA